MHATRIVLCATIALALSGGIALAQPALAAPQMATTSHAQPLTRAAIEAAITKAGYTHIRRLKLDDGVWEAKVLDANQRRVKLSIDRFTGKVYPDDVQPKLAAHDVQAKLAAAGYRDVHDVEFDDGLWTADARNSSGQKVDIKVAPDDGHIVDVHPDH